MKANTTSHYPSKLMKRSISGSFDGFYGIFAVGWVTCNFDAGPITVSVKIDGYVVAEAFADRSPPDPTKKKVSGGAFHVPIPAYYFKNGFFTVEVFASVEDLVIVLGEQILSKFSIDGSFDGIIDGKIRGWCCPRSFEADSLIAEIFIDEKFISVTPANHFREDLECFGIHSRNSGFIFPVPEICFDGSPHTIKVKVADFLLPGSPQVFQSRVSGYIDLMSRTQIRGWVRDHECPDRTILLDFNINGMVLETAANLKRSDLANEYNTISHGFCLDLPTELSKSDLISVTIIEPISNTKLTTNPLVIYNERGRKAIESRITIALDSIVLPFGIICQRRSQMNSPYAAKFYDLKSYLESQIDELNAIPIGSSSVITPSQNVFDFSIVLIIDEESSVMIEFDEFKDYLEKLKQSRITPIVVIKDELLPGVQRFVRQLSSAGQTCLTESLFLDKLLSLNRVFQTDFIFVEYRGSPSIEILIKWHGELLKSPSLASVSPLGSYDLIPISGRFENPKKPMKTFSSEVAVLSGVLSDKITLSKNAISLLTHPRADAFCLKGNLEYPDFSKMKKPKSIEEFVKNVLSGDCDQRYLHALTSNIFMQVRNRLSLENFLSSTEHDSFVEATGQIALELLTKDKRPTILHVTHGLGGGTNLHVCDLSAITEKRGIRSLVLESLSSNLAILYSPKSGIGLKINLDQIDLLTKSIFSALSISSIHVHHVINFPEKIWDLPDLLSVPFDITVHDYFWICPQVTMIDETNKFCSEPSPPVCNRCIELNGAYKTERRRYHILGNTIEGWRKNIGMRLSNARNVFVPSRDVYDRMGRYYSLKNVVLLPHPEKTSLTYHQPSNSECETIDVAVIGAIGYHKGFGELVNLVRWADKYNEPIHFYIYGYVPDSTLFCDLNNITILGPYNREDLEKCLISGPCQLALFLSVWPETYSYTLSEALSAGLTPVGYELGAIGERIGKIDTGVTIPFSASAKTVVDCIKLASSKRNSSIAPTRVEIGITEEVFFDKYAKFAISPIKIKSAD